MATEPDIDARAAGVAIHRDSGALCENEVRALHAGESLPTRGQRPTQPQFAKKLGISKSHLNDIEKGRKALSPDRAARFAKILGYSQARLVKLALQDLVDRGGLRLHVDVRAA